MNVHYVSLSQRGCSPSSTNHLPRIELLPSFAADYQNSKYIISIYLSPNRLKITSLQLKHVRSDYHGHPSCESNVYYVRPALPGGLLHLFIRKPLKRSNHSADRETLIMLGGQSIYTPNIAIITEFATLRLIAPVSFPLYTMYAEILQTHTCKWTAKGRLSQLPMLSVMTMSLRDR